MQAADDHGCLCAETAPGPSRVDGAASLLVCRSCVKALIRVLAAVGADTGMSATKIQEALGAVLAAAQSKRSRGKGGGGGKGAGGTNTPKAVDLGANKKAFLVNVCGLVCRDAKYYIDGHAGGEVARPVAHDGACAPAAAAPKTATGDGGRGLSLIHI